MKAYLIVKIIDDSFKLVGPHDSCYEDDNGGCDLDKISKKGFEAKFAIGDDMILFEAEV